jgi:peptidoglycan/xylan/chitin deacetylase (PgdA/CDA1 family)
VTGPGRAATDAGAARRQWAADAGKWLGGRIALGLDAALRPRTDDRFGILLYHRVAAVPDGLERPTMNVPPDRFARQLEHLLDAGWRFLPVRDVVAAAQADRPLPPKLAVLTFDDGYRNLHANVWPVLRRLQVPATVFVTTAFLDSQAPFPFDDWGRRHAGQAPPLAWEPLGWAECREMERSGLVEIGSHTHTHRNLRGRPEEFAADLATSLGLLERHLGPGPRSFSFPFGSVRHGFAGPELMAAARAGGVSCALTTEIELADPRADRFGWGRLEVGEHDSGAVVAAKLNGRYGWMGAAREGFRSVFRT